MAIEGNGGLSEVGGFLGFIGTAAAFVVVHFLRAWNAAKAEEPEVAARKVIIERADLIDMRETDRLLRDIKPALENIYVLERDMQGELERIRAVGEGQRAVTDANHVLIKEIAEASRKLQNELEYSQRKKQDQILEEIRQSRLGSSSHTEER